MGKIKGCLKSFFIFFNVLFAKLGCGLILRAMISSVYINQLSVVGGPVWIWLFAIGIGILSISCLGIYAGFSEKEVILKIFAGFMGVGMIIMLIFGILVVVERNKGVSGPDQIYAKPFNEVMFKAAMGMCFGFAIIALLGLLVSLLMIHQVRRPDSSGGTSIAMRGY